MELSPELAALRAHDIQPGLTSVNMGLVNVHMKKTKVIGAAAQVCSILRGRNVVPYADLEVAAGDLGIDENLLEKALRELQEIGFVRLIVKGGTIDRVEENIPLLADAYAPLGERLQELRPGEIEQAALHVADVLSMTPVPDSALREELGLEPTALTIVKDIGKATGILDEYTSPADGERVLYSPLYWEENPEKLHTLLKQHGSAKVIARLRGLREHQGKPVDLLEDDVLLAAVDLGCLPVPRVSSYAGEKAFAFTPLNGVKKNEKSILTKARAIVACLRYGQYFGTITRIENPRQFLESMIARKGTKRSHTEIPQQWDLARKLGIGYFDKDVSATDRYFFRIYDNPENIRAFELALQMVTLGDVPRRHDDEAAELALTLPATFVHPTISRLRIKREATYSRESVIAINDLIRGVSSELV